MGFAPSTEEANMNTTHTLKRLASPARGVTVADLGLTTGTAQGGM
jgi:hypothetical protein